MPFSPVSLIGLTLALSAIPLFIGACTSYLKVSIVLGLIKNALGTQNTPGTLVVTSLALALSYFIMTPTIESIIGNLSDAKIDPAAVELNRETIDRLLGCIEPLRVFLKKHAGEREKGMFKDIRTGLLHGEEAEVNSYPVLIPAFVISELKSSFKMGLFLLLPFLVIDLVVANILAGLGMYMMSPVTIALPIKMLLFIQSDAWMLLVKGLVQSYGG